MNDFGWHEDHHEAHGARHAETPPEREKGRRRGPRPMVDRDTVRLEAQVYPEQKIDAERIVTRLKIENRDVPRSDRRRFTANTLVRVALTVLIEHGDRLHGKSEDELLASFRESLNGGRP